MKYIILSISLVAVVAYLNPSVREKLQSIDDFDDAVKQISFTLDAYQGKVDPSLLKKEELPQDCIYCTESTHGVIENVDELGQDKDEPSGYHGNPLTTNHKDGEGVAEKVKSLLKAQQELLKEHSQ